MPEIEMPHVASPRTRRVNQGFGRVLIVIYAIFAIAATARSAVQLSTQFSQAPVAYLLSAIAAVIYIVATIALARGEGVSRTVATVAIAFELAGVLIVGTLSLILPAAFPHASVWSGFGSGYGFIPLILPILGLWWLYRSRH
jgi:cytochrome bd-type quinol oxidase subunit 2